MKLLFLLILFVLLPPSFSFVLRTNILAPKQIRCLKPSLLNTIEIKSNYLRNNCGNSLTLSALNININEWDIYGRVPHDDWLFSTPMLLNPNILKRTMVECLVQEIPWSMAAFKRKLDIRLFSKISKLLPVAVAFMIIGGFILIQGRKAALRNQKWFAAKQGFETPLGAVRKT